MPQRTSKYPPKTLVNLQPVQVFAATFVDGNQYPDTRLVAMIGGNIHFLHPEGVDSKIRQPATWLKDKIRAAASPTASSTQDVEVPESDVAALPVG